MDSKEAEKKYLERTGAGAWELTKPFSPPGSDTLEDSIELLHDFAVAVRLLEPDFSDRIVDLGAGGGWCSDLLQRLNRRSVAVDISHDMLRVSRQRATPIPISAVTGDFERLPFVGGAFDKALCLNALHHIPRMTVAVGEISRVLSDRGVAVFSEPGLGHANKPASLAATQDFGVLEQEVLIEPFMEACHAAGFIDVRVCPIAYIIPEFQLSANEWRQWKRLPRRKRPLRALDKMWRAALEFAGAGKASVLFEEAFAMRLVRLFQQPVEEHPFIVAAKFKRVSVKKAPYHAAIEVEAMPAQAAPRQPIAAALRLTNTGGATWQARSESGTGHVRVGVQLLDADGRLVGRDFARAELPSDVKPGASVRIQVALETPAAGVYEMKFDLVAEGVTWFEPTGSPIARRRLVVRAT